MISAKFKVAFAGPLVTYQDRGRPGHMRFGVTPAGPMDRFAHAAASAMLGAPRDHTAIEVSRAGLVLDCIEGAVSVACAGGGFDFGLGGDTQSGWQVRHVQQGDRITLKTGAWGSWAYLGFAGRLLCPTWLGHSATHALSNLGGGALSTGDVLEVAEARVLPDREGSYPVPDIATPLAQVHVLPGPQDACFGPDVRAAFATQTFRLGTAYDRMGVRLEGPALPLADALSIPSEPVLRGAVQVSGEGVATVLLADHQTTGGYPKIATVIDSDLDRLVQLRSGDGVRFLAISAADAVSRDRAAHTTRQQALATLAAPRPSLSDRLAQNNLISGVTGQ